MEVKWSVLAVGHALTKDCRRKQLHKHMHTLPLSEHQPAKLSRNSFSGMVVRTTTISEAAQLGVEPRGGGLA